ncbi:MAG: nicotinate-nucleotide--dimethylbenzimidazole phosphoribosyltransferase [Planctomycetes bacterium]|nr:nicotinate-nucleotide--dimethylbenzimidazole phosphoribosyltransferase [Planctomycetota bacterium]
MTRLSDTIAEIQPASKTGREQARQRLDSLAMPHWALGQLMDLAESLAAMAGSIEPDFKQRINIVMAGDHGVAAAGVSQYPQSVTRAMVETMLSGGAAINAIANSVDSRVIVVDMGVIGQRSWSGRSGFLDYRIAEGTANIAQGPAMTREHAQASVEAGIQVAQSLQADIFGLGEMGIANTTPATAVGCALMRITAKGVTGRGTGICVDAIAAKEAVIDRALKINEPDWEDGLDVLHKVGGFEIGGMAGFLIGAAALRKPVVIDGLISTAAALIAQSLCPMVTDWMLASHRSIEPLHVQMLEHLGLPPYLDLQMRLGEGTGAALMFPLVDSAMAILKNMATLDEVVQ